MTAITLEIVKDRIPFFSPFVTCGNQVRILVLADTRLQPCELAKSIIIPAQV